jgi:hypothetical protein
MASPFNSANAPNGVTAPAGDALIVTPSDSVDLEQPCRAFYAAVAGNISVITEAGNTRLVPVGAFFVLPLAVTRIRATGTTATGIIGLTG